MTYSVSDGFPYYIELTENNDYNTLFESRVFIKTLENLNETQARYRYEPHKWSLKQIIGHITDHERIMVYRMLCFSRKDQTPLPGYDQDLYVDNGFYDDLPFEIILTDYKNVRQATLSFIKTLTEYKLNLKGTAWKYKLTIAEFLKATIGHELHHVNVLKNKYLV